MKKIRILFILYFTVITVVEAQQSLDCNFNLREAIFYLKGDENFKRDTLKNTS